MILSGIPCGNLDQSVAVHIMEGVSKGNLAWLEMVQLRSGKLATVKRLNDFSSVARNVSFQSLYGGQFTLSIQLINLKFCVHVPTDAAPQFL